MKWFFSFLGFTLTTFSAYANFGLKGEFLYLKPADFELVQASQSTASPTLSVDEATSLNFPLSYRPGFRLEGIFGDECCGTICLRFLYYNSGNFRKRATGQFNLPFSIASQLAVGNFNTRYYALSALFGRWLCNPCGCDISFQAGVHFADIHSHFKLTETPLSAPTPGDTILIIDDTLLDFWGVGPEFDLDLFYPFQTRLGCLALHGCARGALLYYDIVTKTRTFSADTTGFQNLFEIKTPESFVNSMLDFKLGLAWNYSFRCVKTNLELGYEWIRYRLPLDNPTSTAFDGLYLSLGVLF